MIFSERFKLIQECVEEKHKIIGVPIMLLAKTRPQAMCRWGNLFLENSICNKRIAIRLRNALKISSPFEKMFIGVFVL
jgi:hypothetical protein